MTREQPNFQRLRELLVRLMDGGLTESELDELRSLLTQEPELRQYYVEHISLCVNLRQYISGCKEVDVNSDGYFSAEAEKTFATIQNLASDEEKRRCIQQYAQEQLDTFMAEQEQLRDSQTNVPRIKTWFHIDFYQVVTGITRFCGMLQKWVMRGAVLASLVLILMIGILYWWSQQPVATLLDTSEARWSIPIEEGAELRSGSFLLEQGYARIRLKQGAEILVQAPSRFDLLTRNEMFMENGWITARVPPEATGFTIDSPGSSVVDFGTEFGLLVGADLRAEVHVFNGHVALESLKKGGDRRTLNEGDAAILDQTGRIEPVAVGQRVELFVREMPRNFDFGIPGKRLSLADIVGGGSGLDTGRLWQSIDPGSGEIASEPTYRSQGKGHGFIPIPSLPFIDCVFVPDGSTQPPIISSTGIEFVGCPPTSGTYGSNITNGSEFGWPRPLHIGRLNGQTYGSQKFPSISLQANAGITFDLERIRNAMPEANISRFTSLCGLSETIVDHLDSSEKLKVTFWILVDGRVRFQKELEAIASPAVAIDIPLDLNDRFLTLATTDNGMTNCRWSMFAMPALELASGK